MFGSIDNPGVAIWAAPGGEPHHYEVMGQAGIGNFIACEISPSGEVTTLFGDPTAADDVAAKDPRLHAAPRDSDTWAFKGAHSFPEGVFNSEEGQPTGTSLRTPQNMHDWEPGTYGKGFVLNDGTPVTWTTVDPRLEPDHLAVEQYGPHHTEVAADMGLGEWPEGDYDKSQTGGSQGGWHTPVYIAPDGTVEQMNYWAGADESGMGAFDNLPGLKLAEPDEWHFGKLAGAEHFEPYQHGGSFDYDHYEGGQPGKGFILPDGRPVTWNVSGYGEPGDRFFAGAGPHHQEVAMYMGLDRMPDTTDELKAEDRADMEAEGLSYEEPEPTWHSPISIDSQGNYKYLNWNDNFRKEGEDTYGSIGLRPHADSGAWTFSKTAVQKYEPIVAPGRWYGRNAPVIRVDGRDHWHSDPDEFYHAAVAKEHNLTPEQIKRAWFGRVDDNTPTAAKTVRWVAIPELADDEEKWIYDDTGQRVQNENDLWQRYGPEDWTFSKVATGPTVIEHDELEPDLPDLRTYTERKPVLWHPEQPHLIHVGPINGSHPDLFYHVYGDDDDFYMSDDRTGHDYAAGWLGTNPENEWGTHPESPQHGWYGKVPTEVDQALRAHYGLPEIPDNMGWTFSKIASPWRVIDSDFDPAETFYPRELGNPDRSDQRVVITHLPTREIFVGKPGTHHGDLIHHHGLDFETISNMPRDERQYYEPVEDSPYTWTKDEGADFPSMHYGWISQDGGFGGLGRTPEGVTEALHRRGYLQQPDGSVHRNIDDNGDWHFAATHAGYKFIIARGKLYMLPMPTWHDSVHELHGMDYDQEEALGVITPNNEIEFWANRLPPGVGEQIIKQQIPEAHEIEGYNWGETVAKIAKACPDCGGRMRRCFDHHGVGFYCDNCGGRDRIDGVQISNDTAALAKTANVTEYDTRPNNEDDYLPFLYDTKNDHLHIGQPTSLHWNLIEASPELQQYYGPRPGGQAPPELPNMMYGRLYPHDEGVHVLNFSSPQTDEDERYEDRMHELIAQHYGKPVEAEDLGYWNFKQASANYVTYPQRDPSWGDCKGVKFKNGEQAWWPVNDGGDPHHGEVLTEYGVHPDEVAEYHWTEDGKDHSIGPEYTDWYPSDNWHFTYRSARRFAADERDDQTEHERGQQHVRCDRTDARAAAGETREQTASMGRDAGRDDGRSSSEPGHDHEPATSSMGGDAVQQGTSGAGVSYPDDWDLTATLTSCHTRSQADAQVDTPPHDETPANIGPSISLISPLSAGRDSGACVREEMKAFIASLSPLASTLRPRDTKDDPTYCLAPSSPQKGLERRASKPTAPPNYRKGDGSHHCGACKMYWQGKCWGYGNRPVGQEMVCDSFSPERSSHAIPSTLSPQRQGRPSLKEFLVSGSIREAFDFPDTGFEKVYHNSSEGEADRGPSMELTAKVPARFSNWDVQESDVRPEDSYKADMAHVFTHSPWVADPAKGEIYIGPVGTHHWDMMQRYHPGKSLADVPWGTINHGMIHGGQNVTPEMGEAIRQQTGLDLGDGFETEDGWRFATSSWLYPLVKVKKDGRILRGSKGGEHWELLHDNGLTANDVVFGIQDEEKEPLWFDKPDHFFANRGPRGIRTADGGQVTFVQHDLSHKTPLSADDYFGHEYEGRIPLVYNQHDNTLHIGQPNYAHEDLISAIRTNGYDKNPSDGLGWLGYNPEDESANYGWYWGGPQGEAEAQVRNYLGAQEPDDVPDDVSDWHFGSALPEIIELNHDQIREPTQHDWSQDWDMETRRPFVWHRDDNQVVIGPPGTYHSQIDPNHHATGRGAIFVGNEWPDSVNGWGQVPEPIIQHIKDHFGYGDAPDAEWHFGSVDWQVREYPEYKPNLGAPYQARPWIAEWDNKTIHLGQPGWYHADLLTHPERDSPMKGAKGLLLNNTIRHYDTPGPGVNEALQAWGAQSVQPANEWHFGATPPGLVDWVPGTLGKGLVTPEGQAYAWQIDRDHGDDGYPAHHEALEAITGRPTDYNKMFEGHSFYTIYPNGTYDRLHGEPEHDQAMHALMPRHAVCEGCGQPVEPETDDYYGGYYECPNCKFRGDAQDWIEQQNGWKFSATAWQPGSQGKGWYFPGSDKLMTWTGPEHHGVMWDRSEPGVPLLINPKGGYDDQGLIDPEGEEPEDAPTDLSERLKRHDPRLYPDWDWHFGATEGHVLNWQPGQPGKGLYFKTFGEDPEFHTWNTTPEFEDDMDGRPWHSEYLRNTFGRSNMPYQPFHIHEDGTIFTQDPYMQSLQMYDPNIKLQNYGWKFGATDFPEVPDYTKHWQGIKTKSEGWHVWPYADDETHHPDAGLAHAVYMHRYNIPFEEAEAFAHYTPHPNRTPPGSWTDYTAKYYDDYRDIYNGIKNHPEQWTFGKVLAGLQNHSADATDMQPPEIVHIPLKPYDALDDWKGRQTFIYHPHNNRLYLGEEGEHHGGITSSPLYEPSEGGGYDDPPETRPLYGWIEGSMPWWNSGNANVNTWSDRPIPPHVLQALRENVSPNIQLPDDVWRFGKLADAADGEGYEWGLFEPQAHLHFPEGFDPNERPTTRIPFVWTIPHNGDDESHVYFGYPGSHHDDILHPGGQVYNGGPVVDEMHPGLYDRALYRKPGEPGKEWIAGYGSVKPLSYRTGDPLDTQTGLEFYDVPEPQTMGTVADAITAHEPFGLPSQPGFKNRPRMDRPWHEDWHFGKTAGGHQLNFVKGKPGKGLMDKNGVLHTWNTDGGMDGWPSHAEYIGTHPEVAYPLRSAVYITPHGTLSGPVPEYPEYWQGHGYPLEQSMYFGAWEPPAPFWEPGQYGKFIVTPNDHVFAWQVPRNISEHGIPGDGKPSHAEYAQAHPDLDADEATADLWSDAPEYTFGWINPDGRIQGLNDAVNRDHHMDLVTKHVPGTKLTDSDFYFASNENVQNGGHVFKRYLGQNLPEPKTTAPWELGRWGKGALLDGKLHLWATKTADHDYPPDWFDPHHDGIYDLVHPDEPTWGNEGYGNMPKFYVRPTGEIESMRQSTPAEAPEGGIEEQIAAMHPDLKLPGAAQTWNFAKTADDYDEDGWEDEFDRQLKDKMANPPSDEAILDLLDQGVPLGEVGKMLKFDDGFVAAWVPDEHGSPHHDDVIRALGREGEAAKYLYVMEDGSTHDLSETPYEWNF